MPGRPRKIRIDDEPGTPSPLTGPRVVRVLPIQDTVVFPFGIMPIGAGREKSIRLLNDAVAGDRTIAVFMQRGPSEDPGPADLHPVGTLCQVLRMVRLQDGQISAILQGVARVRVGSSRVDLQACKLEYSIVSPK